MEVEVLASGPGWASYEFVCCAGPADRPFEERHDGMNTAVVVDGTFRYSNTFGSAVLGPGAVLLGNAGQCYECGHEHSAGDRCLSVHFTADFWETLLSGCDGGVRADFDRPALPPTDALLPAIARLRAARGGDGPSMEEAATAFGVAVLHVHADLEPHLREPSARDRARISDALHRIEAEALQIEPDGIGLTELAQEARLSPYHFLRSFRHVVGMTPHQYLLHVRTQHAATQLACSDTPISAIIFDAGFGDVSTFNRRFRRLTGMSPGAFRRQFRPGSRAHRESRLAPPMPATSTSGVNRLPRKEAYD